MTPYFDNGQQVIYHADSREMMPLFDGLVVTDPPFNIGFKYGQHRDRMALADYRALLAVTVRPPSVVVHYAEQLFMVADVLGVTPEKVVAWVYNANTARQWRSIGWFGTRPDLSLMKQPYKNPTDKRVAALIAAGSEGRPLYDWWQVNQVKNVSAGKTAHPCQMPDEVIHRVLATTPSETVIDPFLGSGTALRAAQRLGRRAIGIEIDERYCEIAAKTLEAAQERRIA